MSGFDESPFGQPTIENDPFADPAVQQVTRNSGRATLDEYNPFADQSSKAALAEGAALSAFYESNSSPAILEPRQENVPAPNYSKSGQQMQKPPELNQALKDLQAKEAELEQRKAELDRREREMNSRSANVRMNNWPPLPDGFCFQPCFYQDIDVEIPVEFQRIVRHLYYLWIFHAGLLVLNILGAFLLLLHNAEVERLFLAIFFTALLAPISFVCWFRPAYKAFRDDSSFNFMVFFFTFIFQFMISLIQAIGTQGSGTCGISVAIRTFEKSVSGILIGMVVLIIAGGFVAAAVMDVLMISRIHSIYRSSGASMAKAQEEFASHVMKSEQVREASSQIVQGAVRSQFESSLSSQQPHTSNPRF